MSRNIMIVGVGGQGTLLTSRLLGNAMLSQGFDVKVSEVHGMSQRGGSVVTYVRFGEQISSPLIDKGAADVILCFEQLEALRFMEYLKPTGTLIVNEQVIDPMPVITGAAKYPQGIIPALHAKLGKRAVTLDAATAALESGDIRAVNIVLIGVMAGLGLGGIDRNVWEDSLKQVVPTKTLDINGKAFEKGYERGRH